MSEDNDENPIAKAVRSATPFTALDGGRAKPSREPSPEPEPAGDDKVHSLGGFDPAILNRRYALVRLGSKVMVLDERNGPKAPPEFLTIESFNLWQANNIVELHRPGGVEYRQAAQLWMKHKARREYEGVTFEPYAPGEPDPCDEGFFNLWRGFAVDPDPLGDPGAFFDHLLDNVCSGSQELFDWVIAFFAHLVQRPRERIATALAIRGRMGTGKTIVGETIGQLFPSHYFLVDDPRYVVGQFNAHLKACLLMQVDEGFWAGDKQAEGRLKGLISSSTTMIEMKGVDPISVPNYTRLMATSNEDWVVPAGKEERRWCVIDISDRRIRDATYFGALADAMRAPGALGGLLHHLMNVSLEGVNLRDVPETRALYEQKVRTLDPIESWWLERLRDGSQLAGESAWRDFVSTSHLLKSYRGQAEDIGIRRKADETTFGIKMKTLIPNCRRVRRMDYADDGGMGVPLRVWGYVFPPLADCRRHWDELTRRSGIDWEGDDG